MIRLSQEYQSYVNRHYIDRLRLTKYRPTGGIVPFMFVDSFPAILWSVIDYWRVPKRSYYALQTAFSPQYAFAIFAREHYAVGKPVELPLYVVNDAHQAVPHARLSATIVDSSGTLVTAVDHVIDLPADCETQTVDHLRFTPARPGEYTLTITLANVPNPIEHAYTVDIV